MMMIEDDIVKRIVYSKIGGPESIEIIDEELGKPNNNQVKVRVYRAGINFADLMMRQGLYGSNPDFPFTPGYETSGIIIETGNEVKELEVGERVIAMTGFGGYAEEVIVDSGAAKGQTQPIIVHSKNSNNKNKSSKTTAA